MQRSAHNLNGWLKSSARLLLAVFFLGLTLASSSGAVHEHAHHDSGEHTEHHELCVFCSLQLGKLDTAPQVQPDFSAPLQFAWNLPDTSSEFVLNFEEALVPNRGPPVSLSSL
jgi:hypothetical protein